MINFKALVRTIQARRHCDSDTAWSGLAEAYLKLDTTRPEPSQALYLIKVGCFYTYPEHRPPEVDIDEFAEVLHVARAAFDEESFMKALSIEAQAVAVDILNGHLETINERSVRRTLQKNKLDYSRASARRVQDELERTANQATHL